jgi:hypothetical protein
METLLHPRGSADWDSAGGIDCSRWLVSFPYWNTPTTMAGRLLTRAEAWSIELLRSSVLFYGMRSVVAFG